MTIEQNQSTVALALFFYSRAKYYKKRAMLYKVFYRWQRNMNNNSYV